MKDDRQEVHELLRAALRRGDPTAGDALAPAEVRAMRRATLAEAERATRRGWFPIAAPALAAATAIGCLCIALALWRIVSPVPGGGGGKDQVGRGEVATSGRERPMTAPGGPAMAAKPSSPPAPVRSERWERAAAAAPAGRRSVRRPLSGPQPAELAPPLFPTQPVFPGSTAIDGLAEAAGAADPSDAIVRAEIAAIHEEMRATTAAAEPLVASAPEGAQPPGLQLQFSAPGGTRIIWVLTAESES